MNAIHRISRRGPLAVSLAAGIVVAATACLALAPSRATAADEPKTISFVIAKHVLLHEGRIVTWDDVERILEEAAAAGKIYPQFYSTNGALEREEELRERRWKFYGKLYDAGKIDGMGVGSLSPRAGERLDRIKTSDDLAPNMDTRLKGRVLGVDGEPLANVEVFLLPAEHINGVYLRDGRNRNPLEEHLAVSDAEAKFQIYPEEGETLIAAAHPDGFAILSLDDFRKAKELTLKPWARVTGRRPAEGPDAKQGVNFTCYPVPGISFHIYETEIAADGSFEQKFAPPGNIVVSRSIDTGDGGSRSTPVVQFTLAPGESRDVDMGPIPSDGK